MCLTCVFHLLEDRIYNISTSVDCLTYVLRGVLGCRVSNAAMAFLSSGCDFVKGSPGLNWMDTACFHAFPGSFWRIARKGKVARNNSIQSTREGSGVGRKEHTHSKNLSNTSAKTSRKFPKSASHKVSPKSKSVLISQQNAPHIPSLNAAVPEIEKNSRITRIACNTAP